jgi:hypothetical protein
MIKLQPIGAMWKEMRVTQPEKFSVYDLIERFEDTLKLVTQDIDYETSIGYYDRVMDNASSFIEYTENTPIPHLFRMSPKRYFLNTYQPKLWQNHDVNSTIRSQFASANKYAPRTEVYEFNQPYIMFALQSINFRQYYMPTRLFIELIHWAETNQRYVLFKAHPFTTPDNKIFAYWKMLQKNGVITKYAVLVDAKFNTDTLIDNAEMVWTYSSGVGLQAVLQGKPVASFTDQTDYADMYTICKSPAEAALAKVNPDVDRFLSWYYEKLIIDVSRDDLADQITNRIQKCVELDYDVERIFG